MDIVQLNMFDGKVCTKCKKWKHYVNFGKNRVKKDGHQGHCYECRSLSGAQLKSDPSRPRFRAQHIDRLTDGKVCPGCLKWKPYTAYNNRQVGGKYLVAYCVDCNREKKAAHRQKYPDRINATRRLYYQENRDHIREKQTALYNKNPDKFRGRANEYYKREPDKVKSWAKRWYKNNPAKVRVNRHRRRARENMAGGSYTANEWLSLCEWFGGVCLCCGKAETTVDHVIPITKGGSNNIDNLQPLCLSCNCSKQAKHIDYRDPDRLTAFLEHIRCVEH